MLVSGNVLNKFRRLAPLGSDGRNGMMNLVRWQPPKRIDYLQNDANCHALGHGDAAKPMSTPRFVSAFVRRSFNGSQLVGGPSREARASPTGGGRPIQRGLSIRRQCPSATPAP